MVALLSAYMIWFYARKNVEWYTSTSVYIAWFFGFSIIILLPYDVYISYIVSDENNDSYITMMEYIWRINWWIAFVLWYFVFPILGEYVTSGAFTVKGKLIYWVIQNLIFYAVMGLLGGIALLYLWSKGQFDSENGSFSGFLIFWTNAYGLILIILFLGYGVIAVPKKYYGMKQFSFKRKFVYFKVYNKEETFHDKRFKLEELAATALALKSKIKDNIILDKWPQEFIEKAESFASADYLDESDKGDEKSLISLNGKMKKAIEDYERAHWSLRQTLKEAIWLEDIENSEPNVFDSKVGGWLMEYKTYRVFSWYWETKLNPIVSFILFLITTTFSIIIVFGEVSIYLFKSSSSVIRDLFVNNFNNFFLTTVVIMVPLGYLWFCTFYGIFHIKLFGRYALNPNHHTDSFSLNLSATLLTRLAPPLCYNFILLAKLEGTVFEKFMGEMEFIPVLGVSFQELFPILLVVLAIFNLLDVWSRLLRFVGFDSYTFVNKYDREKSEEGQTYVKSQRQKIESEIVDNARNARWIIDSQGRNRDNFIELNSRSD